LSFGLPALPKREAPASCCRRKRAPQCRGEQGESGNPMFSRAPAMVMPPMGDPGVAARRHPAIPWPSRRSGRVAEGGALLRRYVGECLRRGFESLLLRWRPERASSTERWQSGRMRRSRKPLRVVRLVEGSNPSLSARGPGMPQTMRVAGRARAAADEELGGSLQRTAFFTRATIFFSSAAVSSLRAQDVAHMPP
jgi:hypothetical protein